MSKEEMKQALREHRAENLEAIGYTLNLLTNWILVIGGLIFLPWITVPILFIWFICSSKDKPETVLVDNTIGTDDAWVKAQRPQVISVVDKDKQLSRSISIAKIAD